MATTEFPWSGEPIPVSEESIYAAFPSYREHGLATFGPDRVVYSADVRPSLQQLFNTPLHTDDLWIITQPKCGEYAALQPTARLCSIPEPGWEAGEAGQVTGQVTAA